MSIESEHPDYSKYQGMWSKCRIVVAGEEEVKAAGSRFLPILDQQDADDYAAYKERSMFFSASSRTVLGLSGAVTRKDPEINFPEAKKTKYLNKITVDKQGIEALVSTTVREVLTTGRVGLLLDVREGIGGIGTPIVSIYNAESIKNWQTAEIDGEDVLTLVVLEETYLEDGEDQYEKKEAIQYRELIITSDADADPVNSRLFYQVNIWQKDSKTDKYQVVEVITPEVLGARLGYIPFCFANPTSAFTKIEKSPILDLVNMNLSHYRTSADLEHGRHFTALPTAWVAGFDPKTTKLRIGSAVAWVSQDSDAKAGFLEFTGAGLGHLSDGLKHKEQLMAILGSRLLEEQKRQVEATETHKLRQEGEGSVLASIATSVSGTLTKVLSWLDEWTGGDGKNVYVELNKDYTTTILDPTLLSQLMLSWQQSAISWETFFYNLKRGELIPDGRTAEQEKALIAANPPFVVGGGTPEDGLIDEE